SLPMLIAEELDVPWPAVTVEQLPYGLVAARDPPGFTSLYGPQGAGGSTNIPDGWHDLRLAGARARWLLIQTAARVWETPPDRLTTREAHVVHPDGRTLGYAELAPRAAKLDLPAADLPLKARSEYRIIGQPTRVGWPMIRYSLLALDRKSTRLNSSHQIISYAVFCLKEKKTA